MGVPETWKLAWALQSGEQVAREGRYVTKAYYAPKGTTDENAVDAENGIPLGTVYGEGPSVLRRAFVKPDMDDERVLVIFYYEPLPWGGALEENPGTGILEVAFIPRTVRLTEDLTTPTAKPITKVFVYDDAGTQRVRRWHVVKGTPEAIMGAIMVFRVRVVLAAPPLANLAAMVGKVNSNIMSAFGDCGAAGMLLMLAPEPPAKQLYFGQDPMLMTFQLAWCGEAWNETVVTELQQAKIIEQTVFYEKGTAGPTPRQLLTWDPVSGTERVNAKIANEVDMSVINGYLA